MATKRFTEWFVRDGSLCFRRPDISTSCEITAEEYEEMTGNDPQNENYVISGVGTIRWGCTSSASAFRRSSGTVITPTLGSIVQKGKFAACAFAFDKQLKSVDLPTFGPQYLSRALP